VRHTTRIPVVLIGNVLEPLDKASGGMERSTLELARILSERPEVRLTLITNSGTETMRNIQMIRCRPVVECPSDYVLHGDGISKWQHIANDAAILEALLSLDEIGVVHDQSSSVSACVLASRKACSTLKTLRLLPSHPGCRLTVGRRAWTVYISRFQQQMDGWNSPGQSSVIYDFVPYTCSDVRKDVGRVLSVGRVEHRKGHDIAARVAAAMGKQLHVIGKLKDEPFAKSLADNHIVIRGEMEPASLMREITNSEALIWTPRTPEPGGRVVVEALKCGVPVYAVRAGIAADIIDAGNTSRITPCLRVSGIDLFRLDELPKFMNFDRNFVAESHIALYRMLFDDRQPKDENSSLTIRSTG
jgi:glycosyltransferase involved in cell wall biosynthesis